MSKVRKAMILAAGFGTRLRPLTDKIPKPLIPYNGKPMIEYAISNLAAAGVNEFVINLHHHADKMEDYFSRRKGTESIELLKESEILGTGGALVNARKSLTNSGCFFLYNSDIYTNADLIEMQKNHIDSKALVTLAVKERETERYLLLDPEMNILGRTEKGRDVLYASGVVGKKMGFCGIHLISDKLFELVGQVGNFDIIPEYMKLISNGQKICGYDIGSKNWKDLGKITSLET